MHLMKTTKAGTTVLSYILTPDTGKRYARTFAVKKKERWWSLRYRMPSTDARRGALGWNEVRWQEVGEEEHTRLQSSWCWIIQHMEVPAQCLILSEIVMLPRHLALTFLFCMYFLTYSTAPQTNYGMGTMTIRLNRFSTRAQYSKFDTAGSSSGWTKYATVGREGDFTRSASFSSLCA